MNSTRLHLSTMLAVLQQTSQNREYLNRLRAFGLGSLIDAYLTNIASSDGARIGGTVSPLLVLLEKEFQKRTLRKQPRLGTGIRPSGSHVVTAGTRAMAPVIFHALPTTSGTSSNSACCVATADLGPEASQRHPDATGVCVEPCLCICARAPAEASHVLSCRTEPQRRRPLLRSRNRLRLRHRHRVSHPHR